MDKSTRFSKMRARVQAAEAVLQKCEKALEVADQKRHEQFGDAEMLQNAKAAAEGLNLAGLDELRSMKMKPPPVVEIVARCVCTLASGDDVSDAESRSRDKVKQRAKEEAMRRAAAAAQKNLPMSARGQPSPKPSEPLRRRLLTWEDSQRVLARANFKDKIANFDGRTLLENDDLVEQVRARIELSAIKPENSMAANLKMPVKSRKERNEEAAAAVRRREDYAEALSSGSMAKVPLVTLEDARYVSKIAPPLLVWIARILSKHDVLQPAWSKVMASLRDATKKRDEARAQLVALRKKADEIREEEAWKKAKAKEEKERAELLGIQVEEEEKIKKKKNVDRPTELTTPDQIVVSGPTPNLFFQNGRISGIAPRPVELSPRLQLPPAIHFFIRVKHCRVSWPFPPSVSADKYLHAAQIIPGHEEAGPVAHVPFDAAHVIGLLDHQLLSFVQLVIEVPSTDTVNPTIHPARLSFHPRHGAQLHSNARSGGAGTLEMPRIIVTVYPHLVSRHAMGRASSAPHARTASLDGAADGAKTSPLTRLVGLAGRPESARTSPQIDHGREGIPALHIDQTVLRSIGSAYRSSKSVTAHTATCLSGSKGVRLRGATDWAREAIALTERARSRPFALSKPGSTRAIPEVLLQSSAVAVSSAKRLSRSSARLNLDALKALARVVERVTEGYVISSAEKRQLNRAMELEVEVQEADQAAQDRAQAEAANSVNPANKMLAIAAIEAGVRAKAEHSSPRGHVDDDRHDTDEMERVAAEALGCMPPTNVTGSNTVIESGESGVTRRGSADTEALEEEEMQAREAAQAAARAENLPDAEAFGSLFSSNALAAAAAVAVNAVTGAPAAANAAQDVFAEAVQAAAKAASAPAPAAIASGKATGFDAAAAIAAVAVPSTSGSKQAVANQVSQDLVRAPSPRGKGKLPGKMSPRGVNRRSDAKIGVQAYGRQRMPSTPVVSKSADASRPATATSHDALQPKEHQGRASRKATTTPRDVPRLQMDRAGGLA